ncbi:MAG: hypothetical protein ABI656_04305 [bacterium]
MIFPNPEYPPASWRASLSEEFGRTCGSDFASRALQRRIGKRCSKKDDAGIDLQHFFNKSRKIVRQCRKYLFIERPGLDVEQAAPWSVLRRATPESLTYVKKII